MYTVYTDDTRSGTDANAGGFNVRQLMDLVTAFLSTVDRPQYSCPPCLAKLPE